jgi:hypothetical protein
MTPTNGWTLTCNSVDVFVAEEGGHVGPATFRLPTGAVQPYATPSWSNMFLPADASSAAHVSHGACFCLPFGAGEDTAHAETACARWSAESISPTTLHLSLTPRTIPGRVDKRLTVIAGHAALYAEHTISGMTGPMCLGHRTTLQLPDGPDAGRLSTSRFSWGQVRPTPLESSTPGGQSVLRPGARFRSLMAVPTVAGQMTNCTYVPPLRGPDDVIMVSSHTAVRVAWTAVTVARDQYVWFALRDPRVLRSTIIRFAKGCDPSSPQSCRHVNLIGLEDVTAYFDYGLAASTRPNALTRRRTPTSVCLHPHRPFVVRQIAAVAAVPRRFDIVRTIRRTPSGVTLTAASGHRVSVPLDVKFLWRS